MLITKEVRKRFNGKIMFFDIETSLLQVYTHYLGQQYVSLDQLAKDRAISCISWLVEGEKKVHTLTWDKHHNDKKMLEEFKKAADQVDILVGQNGDKFDVKVINGRCWFHQITPFTNINTLDTLKISRQSMRLTSHKLQYKADIVCSVGKTPMGMQNWIDVEHDVPGALETMAKYNAQDVKVLQEVFWSVLPYAKSLPVNIGKLINPALLKNHINCNCCGSNDVTLNGYARLKVGIYRKFSCNSCFFSGRSTKPLKAEDEVDLANSRRFK